MHFYLCNFMTEGKINQSAKMILFKTLIVIIDFNETKCNILFRYRNKTIVGPEGI